MDRHGYSRDTILMTLCERCGNYPSICGCAEAEQLSAQLIRIERLCRSGLAGTKSPSHVFIEIQRLATEHVPRVASTPRELQHASACQQLE